MAKCTFTSILQALPAHRFKSGEVPEWPKGTDCKSVGVSLRRFETSPPHQFMNTDLKFAVRNRMRE
jgi:hypothetical protein